MRVPDLEAMVSDEENRLSRTSWKDSLEKRLLDNYGVLVHGATPDDLDRLARRAPFLPVTIRVQP